MSIPADPVFYATAVVAVSIVGLAKGGFAGLVIVGMSLFALVASPVKAAAIMLPILILQDVVSLWAYRRDYDLGVLKVMLPSALVGTLIAAWMAAWLTDSAVRLFVGVIALGFSANHFLGLVRRATADKPPPGPVAGWFWGILSGVGSFVSHSGGPPYQVWVLPQRLARDKLVGTTAWYFAIVNTYKVPAYLQLGQFDRDTLTTSALLAPVAIVATLAGVRLVRLVPVERFYRLIYGLMVMVGLKLIVDGVRGMM